MSSIATIAVVTSVAAGYKSQQAAKKSTRAQKDSNKLQREINKLKNLQAKRAFLRNFRQQQANVIAQSVAAGVGLDSSAFQGTLQSMQSQAGQSIREFARMDELGAAQTQAMNQISSANRQAQSWGAISQFAASFIGFSGSGSSGSTSISTGSGAVSGSSGGR